MQASSVFDEIAADANKSFSVSDACLSVSDDALKRRAFEIARRGYKFDRTSIEALKAYMQGYGLMISGDVGTGKTLFFDRLCGIVKLSMLNLSAYKLDDIVEQVRSWRGSEVLIDDIGNEPIYNNYGCKMDLLPWIIENRMGVEKRTHFTTNLSGDQLVSRYGARVVDRLHEMCRMFKFTGKSMRYTKVNAQAATVRKYDWTLCAERCENCTGVECLCGITIPPDQQDYRHIPEECKMFDRKEERHA